MQVHNSLVAHGVFLSLADNAHGVAQQVQVGKGDVFADGKLGAQAVLLAVLGSQNDTGLNGIHGVIDRDGLAVHNQFTGCLGIHAENGPGGLGAAGTHQAGKAHDLAGIHFKVDITDQVTGVQILHLEDLLALFTLDPGELLLDFAADHVGNDGIHRGTCEIHRGDVLTVTHDGDPVNNVLQFFQTVGDVNDAAAVRPKALDDAEQFIDFLCRQSRGRFVHNQNSGIDGQCLGDFHHLLLGNRQIAHHFTGINIDLQIGQNGSGFCLHTLLVHHEALHFLTAQEHIFRNRQMGAHIQFLMDNGNTQRLSLLGIQVAALLTKNRHGTAVTGINTGEDLHQSGLTCAVFSQQGHDFTAAQLKVDIVQSLDTGERLIDTLHGDNGFIHLLTHLSFLGLQPGNTVFLFPRTPSGILSFLYNIVNSYRPGFVHIRESPNLFGRTHNFSSRFLYILSLAQIQSAIA